MRLSLGVLLGTENARSLRNLCVLGGVSAVFMYGPSDQQSRDWGNLIFWLVEYWEGPTKPRRGEKRRAAINMSHVDTALPPAVRRWLCLAVTGLSQL